MTSVPTRATGTRHVLVICQLDAYANGVKPVEIQRFLRQRGHDVHLVDTYHLSRSKGGPARFAGRPSRAEPLQDGPLRDRGDLGSADPALALRTTAPVVLPARRRPPAAAGHPQAVAAPRRLRPGDLRDHLRRRGPGRGPVRTHPVRRPRPVGGRGVLRRQGDRAPAPQAAAGWRRRSSRVSTIWRCTGTRTRATPSSTTRSAGAT